MSQEFMSILNFKAMETIIMERYELVYASYCYDGNPLHNVIACLYDFIAEIIRENISSSNANK